MGVHLFKGESIGPRTGGPRGSTSPRIGGPGGHQSGGSTVPPSLAKPHPNRTRKGSGDKPIPRLYCY